MSTKDISHMPDEWQAAYREGAKDFDAAVKAALADTEKRHAEKLAIAPAPQGKAVAG